MMYFNTILRLSILHEYFNDKKCHAIQLYADKQTLHTLNNNQWVLKQTDRNEWMLIGDISNSLTNLIPTRPDIIRLKATVTDSLFLYYTNSLLPDSLSDTAIQCHAEEGHFRSFEIRFPITKEILEKARESHFAEQVIQYTAPRRYWEYLLISRTNTEESKDIYLLDTEGVIPFGATERIDWNGRRAYSIRSLEPVTLKERYPIHIQLFERKKLGKKLLSKNIQPPTPGQFIPEKKNTIQQVIYF